VEGRPRRDRLPRTAAAWSAGWERSQDERARMTRTWLGELPRRRWSRNRLVERVLGRDLQLPSSRSTRRSRAQPASSLPRAWLSPRDVVVTRVGASPLGPKPGRRPHHERACRRHATGAAPICPSRLSPNAPRESRLAKLTNPDPLGSRGRLSVAGASREAGAWHAGCSKLASNPRGLRVSKRRPQPAGVNPCQPPSDCFGSVAPTC